MKRIVVSVLLLLSGLHGFSQNNLPVIKATSKNVDVRDGLHFKRGYWYIMPEKKPDYYFVEIPHKKHRVSFTTDIDSISFDTDYGLEYDFIILLNNKDSCYTRIVAKEKKLFEHTSFHSIAPDTIPFTIGNNSKVYFKGSINNSQPLNIQFDFGNSGRAVIKKSSVKKVNMNFDGSITLTNSDGTNTVPSSSSNNLTIAGLSWDSLPFAVADNMTFREDMIIGNVLFQNKVVEIDYDKKIVVIHDSLPAIDAGYTRHDIILDVSIVPFLQAALTYNSKLKAGWFMVDIGAYTSILSDEDIPATNKMFTEAKKIVGLSSKTKIPQLSIGEYSFSDFNYTTQKLSGEDIAGILGNDLLKRFNIILDNRNGFMYLKPNSLVNESYANPEYYAVRVAAIILISVIAMTTFIIYRKKRRKRKAHLS